MNLRQSLTAVVTAAVVVGCLSLVETHGQAGGGMNIAVVDIEGVFNQLEERTAIEADIRTRISNLQKWEQDKRKELINLQNDLDIMDKSSDNYRKAAEDMERKAIALQTELQFRQRQIEREKAINLENLYRKLIDGIASVAKAEGFDLVLAKDRTPDLRQANQQQVAAVIQLRKLLYANPTMDVTERIKQKLNNDYTNAG